MPTRVAELMSPDPISIRVEASALEAYELMLRHGIRHLPVLSGARLAGVVTADDLAAALALPVRPRGALAKGQREEALEHVVAEMMTYAPVTVQRSATLADAAALMADGRFGCLPVVDERGRLEGIVTETDLLHALAGDLSGAQARTRRKQGALAGLVAELESERARIARELDRHHAVERELTADTHDRPMDLPERSAEVDLVNMEASLDALAARRLAALDRALDHARQGRLSVCDGCGGAISLPRLRALPGTTLCIECARAAEAG